MLLSVAACQLWLPLTQCLHKVFSPPATTLRLPAEIGPASVASFLLPQKTTATQKKRTQTKKSLHLICNYAQLSAKQFISAHWHNRSVFCFHSPVIHRTVLHGISSAHENRSGSLGLCEKRSPAPRSPRVGWIMNGNRSDDWTASSRSSVGMPSHTSLCVRPCAQCVITWHLGHRRIQWGAAAQLRVRLGSLYSRGEGTAMPFSRVWGGGGGGGWGRTTAFSI